MKLMEGIIHFSIFPQNFKSLVHPKLRVVEGNKIKFNEIVTKTPKIPLYFNILFLKNRGYNNIVVIIDFIIFILILVQNKVTYIIVHFHYIILKNYVNKCS